jgi:group I intron endonuclease
MNFVYLTTNKLNSKQYVGSHRGNLNDSYLGSGLYLSESINLHGKENFKRKILEITKTRKEAFDLEEFYIKKFNTLRPKGYNISPTGGMNEWGGIHSEETKRILSEKRKGKTPWNKGKKGIYSKETLEKMRMNSNNTGKYNPMFGKKGADSPIFGIKKTKEHIKKLSESKMGNKNPNAKKYFIQTPDNKEFIVNSATEFINNHPEYNVNKHFIYYQSKKNIKQVPNKWYINLM